MSRINRSLYGPVGGAILLVFALSGIGALLGYQGEHTRDRNEAAEYSANAGPDQSVFKCVPGPKPGQFACVGNTNPSDAADKYTEHDLRAQQDMAKWAFAMFLASVAGVGVTLIGVFYVAATLDETRNMAEEAGRATTAAQAGAAAALAANRQFSESAEREQRAYVALVNADIVVAAGFFVVKVDIKNSGRTPARNPVFRVKAHVQPAHNPTFSLTGATIKNMADFAPGGESSNTFKYDVHLALEEVGLRNESKFLYVWGDIRYVDVFDVTQTTSFRFKMFAKDGLVAGLLDVCDEGNTIS